MLAPLCSRPGGAPVGYAATINGPPGEPGLELGRIRWTLQALRVLAPGAFLLTFPSAAALSEPLVGEALANTDRRSVVVALPTGRVGRRRAELAAAAEAARRAGFRVAVTGHRITSAAGFDAIVVSPRTGAVSVDTVGKPLIALDIHSEREVSWARRNGAALMAGRAVGEQIKVAPVDLQRLRR